MDARLDTGFPRHHKTRRVLRRLGKAGGWSVLCLWLYAAQHRPDGDLRGMTALDLEDAADWDGEEGEFAAALEAAGFLDGEAGTWRLHDWERRNPWVAGANLRSAKARWNAIKGHHGVAEADRQVPEWAAHRREAAAAAAAGNGASSNASSTAENEFGAASRGLANAPSPSPSPKAKAIPPDRSAAEAGDGSPSADALAAATLAGRACRMMREVGCHRTNPSHPDLVAALAEGVTPQALAATAAEAIDAGKQNPFSYAIATARSRHAAGPKTIARGADHAAPGNHRSGPRSAADRVEANVRRARAGDEADDRTFDQTGAPVARDDR